MTSCISTMNVIAQDKKSFTLEDLMPGGNNYFNLQPKNLHGLKWWGDVCVNADKMCIRDRRYTFRCKFTQSFDN